MPNKTQAKAAIDSVATSIKSDIDTILPVGVNITDGGIQFGPAHWTIRVNTGTNVTDAITMANTIKTNLASAGRTCEIKYQRRSEDGRTIYVLESSLTVIISGF